VTDAELAAVGVAVNSVLALLSNPDMLIVDDDEAQCPDAQFNSINEAVLVAPPGATIRVCPGEYRESVLVDKPLFLQPPRQQGQATECKMEIHLGRSAGRPRCD
jgi:pectin methylesterase-like acyl-CoA thioesterase